MTYPRDHDIYRWFGFCVGSVLENIIISVLKDSDRCGLTCFLVALGGGGFAADRISETTMTSGVVCVDNRGRILSTSDSIIDIQPYLRTKVRCVLILCSIPVGSHISSHLISSINLQKLQRINLVLQRDMSNLAGKSYGKDLPVERD